MEKQLLNRLRWALLLVEVGLLIVASAAALPAYGAAAAAAAARDSADAASLTNDESDFQDMGGVDLYLRVYINGASQGRFAHFRLRGSTLYASRAALDRLGFILPAGTPDPVALQSLPGVRVNYNAAAQTVSIMAPISMLNLALTTRSNTHPPTLKATASPGLLMNYDLYASHFNDGGNALNAFSEQRAFGPFGIFSNTLLANSGSAGGGDWHTHTVRLDTFWQDYFPQRMLTVTVGDTLTRNLSWSRATRIAGVQFSRDFSLQPYRVTTPLQAFLGKAAVPSDVELYVDGIRQYQGHVPAGPFDINVNPGITGAGTANMVLTNALGQTTSLSFPFYASQRLLRAGLADWSGSLGVVRKNYGLDSFDYGHDPVLSGFARYGFTNAFTGAVHLEATSANSGLMNAGAGGTWLLGTRGGALNGSISTSSNDGDTGTQIGLGYDWRNRRFGVGLNVLKASGDYRDVASLYNALQPELTASALASWSPERAGNFSLSYVALRYRGQSSSRFVNANWFKSFSNGLTLGVTLNKELANDQGYGVYLSLALNFDTGTTFYANASHHDGNNYYSVGASHPTPGNGGYGWRVQANGGDDSGGYAQAGYLGSHGQITGGVNILDSDHRYLFADANGSLVLMNGDVFAARQVYQSFAVVSTNGVANVPVTFENNFVGETDGSGNLLVTKLLPWQENRFGIGTLKLPADMKITKVKATAVPRQGSGTLVEFPIRRIRAAVITLVNASGKPLPEGSIAHANGKAGEGKVVGYDGMLYLDELQSKNTLEVTTPTGEHCRARFAWHGEDGNIPNIGPLTCTPENPR